MYPASIFLNYGCFLWNSLLTKTVLNNQSGNSGKERLWEVGKQTSKGQFHLSQWIFTFLQSVCTHVPCMCVCVCVLNSLWPNAALMPCQLCQREWAHTHMLTHKRPQLLPRIIYESREGLWWHNMHTQSRNGVCVTGSNGGAGTVTVQIVWKWTVQSSSFTVCV